MARPKSRADDIRASSEAFVGTKDAAAMLGMSVSTVQKMVESGKLRAWRTQGGHRRIAESDVRRLGRELAAATGRAPTDATLRILIVEDNHLMRRAYAKVAAQWGERVVLDFANDAAAALLLIAQHRPDLVVTDLAMAPLDGFHLIRTLRASAQLADTRIMVVTGLPDEEIAARGGLDARTLCYHKPLSFERFAGFIDARLQEHAYRA